MANAREILCKERGLLDSLDGLVSTKRLALACTPTFGMAYLPQVLNIFLRTHAEVADLKFIFLQPLEILRRLRNEEFDLTVLEHSPDQEFTGLDRIILPDDELLLVAPASLVTPDANGYVDLAELTRYRLFARRDGCSSKELLRLSLARKGINFTAFEGVMISDDLRFTVDSVIAGEGIAFMSRSLIDNHLSSGRLIDCRIEGFERRRGRSVALLPGRHSDPLIGDFLKCIFQVVVPGGQPQLVAAKGGG